MKTRMILNDPPYGSERSYNGKALAARNADVTLFLMAGAVAPIPQTPRSRIMMA